MQQLDPVAIITMVANHYGIPPSLALAIAQHESGLNPNSVGDNGTSFGLYQLHIGGELGNRTPASVTGANMENNAIIALSTVAAVMKANPGASPGDIAAMAQRPANPGQYAATINSMMGSKASYQNDLSGMSGGPMFGSASANPNPIFASQSSQPIQNTMQGVAPGSNFLNQTSGTMNLPTGGSMGLPTQGGSNPLESANAQGQGQGQVVNTNFHVQASDIAGKIGNFMSMIGLSPTAAPPAGQGNQGIGQSGQVGAS